MANYGARHLAQLSDSGKIEPEGTLGGVIGAAPGG